MAEEEERETEEWIHVVVGVDIWLRDKPEPFFANMRVRFKKDGGLPDDLEELTDAYANIILGRLDSRQCIFLTLEDERENRYIVYTDQIQALKVVAPDKMPEALEKETE